MKALGLGPGLAGALVYLNLKAVKRKKAIIVKIIMRDHNIVVCVSNDRISQTLVKLLKLGRRKLAVGIIGVAVQICLVEITCFLQKILFHNNILPQLFISVVIIVGKEAELLIVL